MIPERIIFYQETTKFQQIKVYACNYTLHIRSKVLKSGIFENFRIHE